MCGKSLQQTQLQKGVPDYQGIIKADAAAGRKQFTIISFQRCINSPLSN